MSRGRRGRVIGEPLNFKTLARAPVNELGVVYLFGLLHDELGLQVESIQAGFPDCIAHRRIGLDRWEQLRIEFELESKAFVAHGHDPSQVDMIVCWRHDWAGCPSGIEVLELSAFLRARGLAGAASSRRRPLSAWQVFAREQRLEGRSMAEIAQLWKKRPPRP